MDNDSKLQIVVNDEIIDLRNHDFDDPKPFKRSLTSTKSTSKKTFNPEEQRQTANGLRKLASTLYNGPSNPLLQKHRNIIRSRQKLRAFSVDPRFRRERSPQSNSLPSHCHSESNVAESIKIEQPKVTQSAHSVTKDECSTLIYPDHPGDSLENYIEVPQVEKNRYSRKNKEIVKRRKRLEKENFETSVNCNLTDIKNICECENFKRRDLKQKESKFVEQGTMTDEYGDIEDDAQEVNYDACKSYYESAISELQTFNYDNVYTDIASNNVCATSLITPIVNSDMKISRDISPYWDDPRLVQKYAALMKPITLKQTKSSWTLPLSNNKKALDSPAESSLVFGYSSNILNTYKYDNSTDIDEGSMSYETAKNKLWEALWKNYNFTPFFLLGSLCGIGLVAVLGWMIASDFLWVYFYPVKKEEKWYTYWFNYFCGGILHALESFVRGVTYILLVPRHEIFNRDRERGYGIR